MSRRGLAPAFILLTLLATGCQSTTTAPGPTQPPLVVASPVTDEPPPVDVLSEPSPAPDTSRAPSAAVPTVVAPAISAPPSRPAASCLAPASAKELAADKQLLANTAGAGIALTVERQCAGFSLFYQDGIGQATVADYGEGLTLAYNRLVSDTGLTPSSVDFLVFADTDQRRKAANLLLTRKPAEVSFDLAPAFATGGSVWVDLSKSPQRAARMSVAAHELTHVFVGTAAAHRAVPQWLNEGLAVYGEMTLPAAQEPTYVEADALDRRRRVLDAASGKGPIPLFALDDLTTDTQWQANYPNVDKRALQYAQGYSVVKWLVDRDGLPAVWKLMKTMSVVPFREALPRTFSMTPAALETQAKASWMVDLASSPSPIRFTVRVTPAGVRPETRIVVRVGIDGKTQRTFTNSVRPGEYSFELSPSGELREPAGSLKLQTDNAAPLSRDGLAITIASASYHGADGMAPRGNEQVTYWLSYGRWAPAANGREFYPQGKTQAEFLRGVASSPFPDGNAIDVTVGK